VTKQKSKKQDQDLKNLSPKQLRQEIMRLRKGLRRWRDLDTNAQCHQEDQRLINLLPEGGKHGSIRITVCQFKKNCDKFIQRQLKAGYVDPE
jgi:hypothetical protein